MDKKLQLAMAQWVQTLVDSSMKQHASSTSHHHFSIFRAPRNMRKADQQAFEPELVSIGPFHRNNPALPDMEGHKLRFLSSLLGNQTREERELSLQSLAEAMRTMEQNTRVCYSETFDDISGNDFVRMMVLDGCFILQLLRFYQKDEKNDPIFRTQWMVPALRMDLLRLENQLPIQVLQRLLLLTRSEQDRDLVIPLALNFFAPLNPCVQARTTASEPEHLLALIHFTLKPGSYSSVDMSEFSRVEHKSPGTEMCSLRCATDIWHSGVVFKKGDENLLDIKFQERVLVLEIPQLCIGQRTGPLFKNLVAYEQCNTGVQPYLTSYIAFFKGLVNSLKDVELLRGKGIVSNDLGSGDEEVYSLIHDLAKDIVYEKKKCYLLTHIQKIQSHCNRRTATHMRVLKQQYFSSPWAAVTLIQAILILQLTVIQTLYTVLSYTRQDK